MIGFLVKHDYIFNPSTYDCECKKACKIHEYSNIKKCSCRKRLIGKLVLKCEDEILNATETLFNNKHVACAKTNCLIHTISLVIIYLLLLAVICVSCYFYYAKYQPKYKHLISFYDSKIKLGRN